MSTPQTLEDVEKRALLDALHRANGNKKRAAEILESEFPELAVTVSHRLTREFREYERTATTAVDALIRPRLARYGKALVRGHAR